jgi:hypothetical protein
MKINRVEFITCVNELKNVAHNGFSEQEVEIFINALVSVKNLSKLFLIAHVFNLFLKN